MKLKLEQVPALFLCFLVLSCLSLWTGLLSASMARNASKPEKGKVDLQALAAERTARTLVLEKQTEADGQVRSKQLASDERKMNFNVQVKSSVAEHIKKRISTISISVNENSFDAITTESFNEVAKGKKEFVIIVVCDPETGVQKSYEASSFVQCILVNGQAKVVLLSPNNTPLMNANLIYCIKYQADDSGQAPSLTYLCSWADVLQVGLEEKAHVDKRNDLLFKDEYFLLNQLGGLEQWAEIGQQFLGGAVMRKQAIKAQTAGTQNVIPLTRGRYIKSFIGLGLLCFLQGFFNNWNARRNGYGVENWAFYSKKCPWGDFFRLCLSLGFEKEWFPQASESLLVRWFGAGAQILGECVPCPTYPYLWRQPVLTFRLFRVMYDTGLAVVQSFRE